MRQLLLPLAAAVALTAAAPAQAAELIEGTWDYGGGEVLVRATGPGTYSGTVVKDTQFSECPHRAGELMWDLNGSGTDYFGGHRWFTDVSTCTLDPEGKGQAQWRITSTDPARFQLELCTVPRGQTLTPDNPQRRCNTLTRLRPLEPPVTPAVQRQALAELPRTKKCQSRRVFRIRVKQVKDTTYRSVSVKVRSRSVPVVFAGGRHTAKVDLRKLPKGRFTVKVAIVTAEGQTISDTRRYRTCTPKRRR